MFDLLTLLDKLSFSKLLNNHIIIRTIMFELEQKHGSLTVADSINIVKSELVKLDTETS